MHSLFYKKAKHAFRRLDLVLQSQWAKNYAERSRYILLPELPPDTAETNIAIRCAEQGFLPPFKSLAIKDCINSMAKLGLELESWTTEYFQQMGKDSCNNFVDFYDPIEHNTVPVEYAWGILRQRHSSSYFDSSDVQSHLSGLFKLLTRVMYTRYAVPEAYAKMKEFEKNFAKDSWEARLIRKHLLEGHMNGLHLTEYKRFQLGEIRTAVEGKKSDYKTNLSRSEVQIKDRSVDNQNMMPDAPEHVLRLLADNPDDPLVFPFTVRCQPHTYYTYLQYCRPRMARHAWWYAVNARASFHESSPVFNNSTVVEEIRHLREREAKWVGYKNYVSMQLQLSMAKTVEEVRTFLTAFGEKASDNLDALYEDMCAYAKAEGPEKDLPDAWDLPYYARAVADQKYKLNHQAFAEHFPYPETVKNILSFVARVFNVEIKNVSQATDRWHPSVETYEIRKKNSLDSSPSYLYIDPYLRKGKIPVPETICGRPSTKTRKPIAFMNFHLTQPSHDRPSLMYFSHLAAFTYELGRALQVALSESPYCELSGVRGVELDCKDVCAYVVQLLICRPRVLVAISGHFGNGSKIDMQTAESHVKGYRLTKLPSIVRQVVDSELDLSMHSSRAFWRDTYAELHSKYLPYKWEKKKGDEYVCNFGGFATEYVTGKYYSILWAKKLASDIVQAFEEAESQGEKATEAVGEKFANLYLSESGRYDQSETFQKFRGRAPTLEPMLKYYFCS